EGLVDSLNRPGGNATGVTIFGPAAVTKRLQLLHDLVPQADAIAFLMNPYKPNGSIALKAAQAAATSLGRQIVVFSDRSESELDAAFASMVQQRVGMVQQRVDILLGASDPFLFTPSLRTCRSYSRANSSFQGACRPDRPDQGQSRQIQFRLSGG